MHEIPSENSLILEILAPINPLNPLYFRLSQEFYLVSGISVLMSVSCMVFDLRVLLGGWGLGFYGARLVQLKHYMCVSKPLRVVLAVE